MIDKIKRYYDLGIYKEKHIHRLLELNRITQEEYDEIIGDVSNEESME